MAAGLANTLYPSEPYDLVDYLAFFFVGFYSYYSISFFGFYFLGFSYFVYYSSATYFLGFGAAFLAPPPALKLANLSASPLFWTLTANGSPTFNWLFYFAIIFANTPFEVA